MTTPNTADSKRQFDDFLRGHYDALLWYAVSLCKDWQLAEDLVQECFLKLWRTWTKRREEVKWHRNYAYTALRNTYIDYVRKWRPSREELHAEMDESLIVTLPVDVAARAADRHEVLKILRLLSERHQEIFFLNEVSGFTPAEIGNLLGMRARTVSNYLCSIRKQVTALLSLDRA